MDGHAQIALAHAQAMERADADFKAGARLASIGADCAIPIEYAGNALQRNAYRRRLSELSCEAEGHRKRGSDETCCLLHNSHRPSGRSRMRGGTLAHAKCVRTDAGRNGCDEKHSWCGYCDPESKT